MCSKQLSGKPVSLGGLSSPAYPANIFAGRQTSRPNPLHSVFKVCAQSVP